MWGFPCLYSLSLPSLIVVVFLIIVILTDVNWHLTVVLNYIFLTISDVKPRFTCLLAICIFFGKVSIQLLCAPNRFAHPGLLTTVLCLFSFLLSVEWVPSYSSKWNGSQREKIFFQFFPTLGIKSFENFKKVDLVIFRCSGLINKCVIFPDMLRNAIWSPHYYQHLKRRK